MIDTARVVNVAKVEDKERLFRAKKRKIGNPFEVAVDVDDVVIQALYHGKPALKLRANCLSVDVKMQNRGLLKNYSIAVKL